MDERAIYRRQNFGNRLGFGRRPALIIVDFVNGFADEAIFGGGNIAAAIAAAGELLESCRRRALPIAMTRIVYADDGSDAGTFASKAPGLRGLTERAPEGQIVPSLAPRSGEYVLRKTQPSAFFGTDLAGWLVRGGIDTLLVAGCTTSGCVRATVVDAASYNFRPIVVRDCVGDRALGPHEASLFDIEQKYGDVVSLAEAVAALESSAAG